MGNEIIGVNFGNYLGDNFDIKNTDDTESVQSASKSVRSTEYTSGIIIPGNPFSSNQISVSDSTTIEWGESGMLMGSWSRIEDPRSTGLGYR